MYSAIKLQIEMSSCEASTFGKAEFPHSGAGLKYLFL